jgi:hypothetical protein
MFPICNAFFRASALRAAGGFSAGFAGEDGGGRPGWDSELGWRLKSLGWQTRYDEGLFTLHQFRRGPGSLVEDHIRRASGYPALLQAVPGMRSTLMAGVFASKQTMYFDIMLLGAALALLKRRRLWLLAAVPWLGYLSNRLFYWPPQDWPRAAKMAVKIFVLHGCWLLGFLRGSLRARRIVL